MSNHDDDKPLTEAEIARRRDAAISRALNTPPKKNSQYIGTTERAKAQRETRAIRAARLAKQKDDEGA